MQLEELKELLKNVADELEDLRGEYEESKRWRKINNLVEEIELFHINQEEFSVYYDNIIMPMEVRVLDYEIVCPVMIFYTNFCRRILETKCCVTVEEYELILEQKEQVEKAVYGMCSKEFESTAVTVEKLKKIAGVLRNGKMQLKLQQSSNSECVKFQNVMTQYEKFKIGKKYVYYYDAIVGKDEKCEISSTKVTYAVWMSFYNIYIATLQYVFRFPDAEWEFFVPWNAYMRLRHEMYCVM